jgi:hypothetical protein
MVLLLWFEKCAKSAISAIRVAETLSFVAAPAVAGAKAHHISSIYGTTKVVP